MKSNKFLKTILFLTLWLFWGFAMGTILLLFPLRWTIEFTTQHQWSKGMQDAVVILLMLILVVISLFTTRFFYKKSVRSTRFFWISILLSFGFFVGAIVLWLNPKFVNFSISNSEKQSIHGQSAEFIFGPYPTEEQMIQLKKDSVTAIISLLHPAVVPFEPVLINEEIEHTTELGLKFIHLPMLPWVSNNTSAIDSVKSIAKNGSGKYYVHCYLGKDRVNLVKKAILEVSQTAIKKDHTTMRHLWDKDHFERGKIIRVDSGLYIIPYPTDEEYMGYILSSDVKSVVSIQNPKNKDDVKWIDKEDKLVKNYPIHYSLLPLQIGKTTSKQLDLLIDSILSLPKPIVVHSFLIPSPESDLMFKALTKRIGTQNLKK